MTWQACAECGAVVADPDQHATFHASIATALETETTTTEETT